MSVYPPDQQVLKRAILSDCQQHRYLLSRRWAYGKALYFVMLNPSTADASQDDPTIRRCVGFARTLGFGAIMVSNLYSFRATDPKDLKRHGYPTGGDENDSFLKAAGILATHGETVVAAWGAHARADRVEECMQWEGWDRFQCLGLTSKGQPRHPLMLAGSTPLQPLVQP